MSKDIILWFPNYRRNPGIVSRELRREIGEMLTHFDASVEKSYYEGHDKFVLEFSSFPEGYESYLTDLLHQKYGKFINPEALSEGDLVRGRLISPGKVGFGIFVDIGIRHHNEPRDALLPLFQLRTDFNEEDQPLREIVKRSGLVNGLPLEFEVKDISGDDKKISLGLSDQTIERFEEWKSSFEKLVITKTLHADVVQAITQLNFKQYIESIEKIDPLTSVIHCLKKTRASGLIPKIGAKLTSSPIGIIHPI